MQASFLAQMQTYETSIKTMCFSPLYSSLDHILDFLT